MKITINNKEVEQTTLGTDPVWVEVGTTNIISKVGEIPTGDITYDCTYEQQIIGSHIREFRKMSRMNAVEFSKLTGMTRASIQAIEEGKISTSIQILVRICKVLDVKMTDIMEGI